MNIFRRVLSLLLMLVLVLTGLPVEIKAFAAEEIELTVEYNPVTYKYEISSPLMAEPQYSILTYHDPSDKSLKTVYGEYRNGRVVASVSLEPNHIYDLYLEIYRAGDGVLSHYGKTYYLADLTFTGESFNEMAKMRDIEDKAPILEPKDSTPGNAMVVKSGDNPIIKLSWKIPTIYDPDSGEIINFTEPKALELLGTAQAPLSKACFQISMTVGQGSTRQLVFNTDYDSSNNMIIEGKNVKISGFESGVVTSPDNMVSVVLSSEEGIEPGTEYAFTNIGILFKNADSEQVNTRITNLKTNKSNRFPVKNIDNVFKDIGKTLTSIFTPMQIELMKVDTDKVEVRFRKIVNGNYPELYYQVQYVTRIEFFFTDTDKWVKIPASALSASEEYGSEIIDIPIDGDKNPEYYFRVVYYDSSSEKPRSSSLAVDLRNLSVDSGKPPLPKEIRIEAVYAGRGEVKVPNEHSEKKVEIPKNDLRLSFEKPLAWKQYTGEAWTAFKNSEPQKSDIIFHVLLSTLLPDAPKTVGTTEIGTPAARVYLPTVQKRVLVLSKRDFIEDPDNPDRIICNLPGDKLFVDYAGYWDDDLNMWIEGERPLTAENNEDDDENDIGDYPDFLLPNTTYYMQIFSSRLEDNDDIYDDVWADGLSNDLNNRLSYKSPIISFTTWPLTEKPVPMPDISLSIEPETFIDPETGEITLEGIRVKYPRLLTNAEWKNYDNSDNPEKYLIYEFFISRDPLDFDEIPIETDEVLYPSEESEKAERFVIIKKDKDGSPILPNTVYYIKARATLMVGPQVLGRSVDTAVKTITTPKIDSGGLDNDYRDPRAPVEFSIATDANGELLLSDAWVTLSWVHAENDVTYEMVCTSATIPERANDDDYKDDPVNIGFLQAYNDLRNPAGDNKIHIDVNTITLEGFSVNENGKVIMPIRRDFLRPNRIYFFSLRAVRNRGKIVDGESVETTSIWITIPVTTRMVQPPGFIETVKDMEIGFNIKSTALGVTADSMEVYMKKSEEADSRYVQLNRAEYTCVQDGTTFYFRIYNLEADQWYDIQVKNKNNGQWYDNDSKTWRDTRGTPVRGKTRDPFSEIEVRFEGQDPYDYFLEIRTDNDTEYRQLVYHPTGETDYGYETESGRIEFYREKTRLYVDEGSPKYVYYVLIRGRQVPDENGVLRHQPLKSNTQYYVKLWAFNLEESLHIGPAIARTDFSQDDYDKDKIKDNVIDLFKNSADKLTQKLYWRIDIKNDSNVRVILKDDRVSSLLKASRESTVTVNISVEQDNTSYYEVLIPYKTLEAIENYGSRLTIKILGAEFTLNKGSVDIDDLKAKTLSGGAKEAMLLLKIYRRQSPKNPLPSGITMISKAYELQTVAVGSRRTYEEINNMLYDILNNPDAKGPFKYGILDRELTAILNDLEKHSYKSHTDLKDMINTVINKIETELSRYLKDIIDGGSGLTANYAVSKDINDLPGRMGVNLEYTYRSGYIAPYVNYGQGFAEPAGGKGYVMQYVLFRVEKPGEYLIINKGEIAVQPGTSSGSGSYSFLSSRYDLTKVFGPGTVYTANPISGEQAVMLYAVVTRRENEITGLTPAQKAAKLGIADVIGRSQLTGYMDNQSSVAMVVKLYCAKANINPDYMKPSRVIFIENGSDINPRLYPYVVLGVDLEFTTLNNNRFDATGRTTIGNMLDMISKVLEKLD
ncbi:MAG: hypothetical protein GX022_04185 [Clostridiaceae bacterium]|nr:hypothetical protein [Clostridiaceae bacterium]